MGQHALCGAEVIQQAKDLVVERDRPRLVVDVALAVDRQDFDIFFAEQAGRDDALSGRDPPRQPRNRCGAVLVKCVTQYSLQGRRSGIGVGHGRLGRLDMIGLGRGDAPVIRPPGGQAHCDGPRTT